MNKTIGLVGLGKMGEALVKGLQKARIDSSLIASTRNAENARSLTERLKIKVVTDNQKLIQESDVVVLCVKPHQVEEILRTYQSEFSKDKLLISICASITTSQLALWSGKKAAIVRAMPNTPALIGEGMTVYCSGPNAQAKHLDIAETIFSAVGRTACLDEELMDGVTGLSGCGPAYVYLVIEALSEAGVKVGIPRKAATLLAAQTLLGASKMVLDRPEHPAALKDEVTTPAGCTIDGLMALEEGKLRIALIKAVLAATKRSKSLREKK